jgi:F0F1-type ATP synthase assembly protein I
MSTITPTIAMTTGPDRRPTDRPQHWLAASSAPWLMIAATVMGVVGGLALDRWLDCTPWGVLGCSLAGIAVGIYLVIREGSR